MAVIDWIPVAGTIKNALADPKGRKVADYTCTMDQRACGTAAEPAAILECARAIQREMAGFINAFVGGGVVDPYVGGAVSLTTSAIVGAVTRRLIQQAAGRSAVAAAGGATALLAVDGFINLYITLDKLNEIKVAAQQAIDTCCACEKILCGDAAQVATGESITRYFFGAERSFRKTKEAMQAKAEDDHQNQCVGDCPSGTCKPVAYVTEWDQGGFAMHRTTLTYDVYCECA